LKITEVEHLYIDRNGTLNPDIFDEKVIIYGCKNAGKYLYDRIQKAGGQVEAFVDRRAEEYEKTGFCGIKVIPPFKLNSYKTYSVIISFVFWPQIIEDIADDMKVYADYPFWEKSGSRCILCGSSETVSVGSGFVPFLQERMFLGNAPRTDWVHCRNCEVSFSSYRPTEEEFGRLYSGYRGEEYSKQRKIYEPWYDNELLFGEESTDKRRRDAFAFCRDIIDHVPKMILDYGGDRGQYIPKEWDYSERYVYEVSGNAPIDGVKAIDNLENAMQFDWDLIMNCHVLEHVSDPGEIIDNIRSLMNDHTLFYLELPCEFATGNMSVHEHINGFTKRTLQMIGEKYDLDVLKCGNLDCGGGIAAIYKKR